MVETGGRMVETGGRMVETGGKEVAGGQTAPTPGSFAAAITKVPLFSTISRENLARIVGRLEELSYQPGEVIFSQGDDGDGLYIVHAGAAEVLIEQEGLPAESVAMLGPSECFGEMALFSGEKRSATVRALVNSTILRLARENWDELLTQHPSMSLYFCKVLSQRLSEREASRRQRDLGLGMTEFFASLSTEVQDFLIQTSVLRCLDTEAIEAVLDISDAKPLLDTFASAHDTFVRKTLDGNLEIPGYFRDFLQARLEERIDPGKRMEIHLRFAAGFAERRKWGEAVEHFIKAEAWAEALKMLEEHGDTLLASEPAEELLKSLDALQPHMGQLSGQLTRLRAEAFIRIGNLDAAIDGYDAFLAQKRSSVTESLDMAQHYRQLANLHHENGDVGEAFSCLQAGLTTLESGTSDTEAMQAIQAIGALQRTRGRQEDAFEWGSRAINIAAELAKQAKSGWLNRNSHVLGLLFAAGVGWSIWQLPPSEILNEHAIQFLGCLAAAITLWMLDIFEQYVVALLLLLSWLVFDVVSPAAALAGFSKTSWFFVFGVLGIGAAVTRTGLLYRVALKVLRCFPPAYKMYTFMLSAAGVLATPMLPTVKARLAIIMPLTQEISDVMGFKPRSRGSAGLTLSAFIGFSQMTFMFLTGATVCLVGWSLIPEPTRSEFAWSNWFLAAAPAGIVTLLFLYLAVLLLFRVDGDNQSPASVRTLQTQLEVLGPLTQKEWLGVAVLVSVAVGFLTKPLHGIGEAWIALGGLAVFLVSGVLDRNGFRNNIDWGYLVFLGILSSLAGIMFELKLDGWLKSYIQPVLAVFSFGPLGFLLAVVLIVYLVRIFLKKIPVVILLMLLLTPLAEANGIHLGVLLITILLALESWFLPYQTDSYQVAYYSTDGRSFSHLQARKLMIAKFFASLLAVTVSVPYWQMLGYIR